MRSRLDFGGFRRRGDYERAVTPLVSSLVVRAIPSGCALTFSLALLGCRSNPQPSGSVDSSVDPPVPTKPLEAKATEPPPPTKPEPPEPEPPEPAPPKCTSYPPPLPSGALPDFAHIRQPLAGLEGLGAIVEVEAGEYRICAVDCHGRVYCWYPPNELDVEDDGYEKEPPTRVLEADEIHDVDVANSSVCGLTNEGRTVCYYDPAKRWDALAALPRATAVVVHANNRCVMTEEGAYCWGENWRNALGLGQGRISEPTALPVPLVQLSVQHDFGCGVTPKRGVTCWGANPFYRSDCSNRAKGCADAKEPISANHPTLAGLSDIESVTTGWEHACALTAKGEVLCWGSNDAGEAGGPSRPNHWVPTRVEGLPTVDALEAGFQHTCATTEGGEAYCWGSNIFGQIGPTDADEYRTPKKLTGLPKISLLSPGESNTCALTESGHVLCWGVAPDPSD